MPSRPPRITLRADQSVSDDSGLATLKAQVGDALSPSASTAPTVTGNMAPFVPQRGQLYIDQEGRRWCANGVVHLGAKGSGHFIVSLRGTEDNNNGELVLSSADFNLLAERGALRQILH